MHKIKEICDLFIENEEKLVYRMVSHEVCNGRELCYTCRFELVAGWDYVNPDESDVQGYVPATRFVDDVQLECFVFYPLAETLTNAIEENGFQVRKNPPLIRETVPNE